MAGWAAVTGWSGAREEWTRSGPSGGGAQVVLGKRWSPHHRAYPTKRGAGHQVYGHPAFPVPLVQPMSRWWSVSCIPLGSRPLCGDPAPQTWKLLERPTLKAEALRGAALFRFLAEVGATAKEEAASGGQPGPCGTDICHLLQIPSELRVGEGSVFRTSVPIFCPSENWWSPWQCGSWWRPNAGVPTRSWSWRATSPRTRPFDRRDWGPAPGPQEPQLPRRWVFMKWKPSGQLGWRIRLYVLGWLHFIVLQVIAVTT
jgi:hypothetical protein